MPFSCSALTTLFLPIKLRLGPAEERFLAEKERVQGGAPVKLRYRSTAWPTLNLSLSAHRKLFLPPWPNPHFDWEWEMRLQDWAKNRVYKERKITLFLAQSLSLMTIERMTGRKDFLEDRKVPAHH